MPKYKRRKFMEESNGASGEYPEHGAIFMSNSSTRKECLRRQLFGLPMGQAGFVKQVKAGMLLFLFEFETRELHGVFQACSDGAINIQPDAYCSSGKQFPAQVKFTEKWYCMPLAETEFRHAISDNYFTPKKFNFGLSKAQVQRLLKLFSLKKVERPRTATAKHTRTLASRLGDTTGGCGSENRSRLTENDGLMDESDIGVKTEESGYSREASAVFRRLGDPKLRRLKDRVGYDFSMNNSSRTDDDSDRSPVNGRRVLKNLRPKDEYHEKDGVTHPSSRSNHKEHLNFEADSVDLARSSVPLESAYGTNTECYDPCNPGIMGDATLKSSRHDIKEEIIPDGGLDYYIPMPTEHPEYQTSTSMTGVACFESESRYGHLHHCPLPGFLTSPGASENTMMNSERLSYSSHSIFPSFAYPSSSTDLSPKDGVNYQISAYQDQEEFRGHSSYANDRVGRDSRIYPSFAYPSTPGDEEFGGEAFDSDNRVSRMRDRVSPPVELERERSRKSVFSRLVMPSKERDADKDSSPVTEPVDEVTAFLNDCQKYLMEQKRSSITDPVRLGKPKKEKEEIHTKEVLNNDLILPFTETSPDDLLDCEERMEHSDQKRPFIDFMRRSEAQKSSGNPTQGCKDILEDSSPQDKKRKLLRPKLEDDSDKDRGNNDNPIENDMASGSASEVPVLDLLGQFGQ